MTGNGKATKAAAAEVVRLDPDWTVEKYLSDRAAAFPTKASLFVEGARRAGIAACVPANKLSSLANLIRIKACDEVGTHQAAG